jgi:hypothetical protein
MTAPVDGSLSIASRFADAGCAWCFRCIAPCSQAEIQDIIKIGYLNGLFVLARSIGLIGHALDQKRLQQGLYRHPWDEVRRSMQPLLPMLQNAYVVSESLSPAS